MPESFREQLARAIRDCGDSLCRREMEGAPLRTLQRALRPLLGQKEDPKPRALAFILDTWIDDFYFNLAADVPSKISEEFDDLRNALLCEQTGPVLQELAAVVEGGSSGVFDVYSRIVTSYLDAVEQAEGLVALDV